MEMRVVCISIVLLVAATKIRGYYTGDEIIRLPSSTYEEEGTDYLQQTDDDDSYSYGEMFLPDSKGFRRPVNVETFGAVGDGVADDTQAFLKAWEQACSMSNAVFLVPGNRTYKVGTAMFKGPCHGKLMIQVQGKIVAPDEPNSWDPQNPRTWLIFSGLKGAHIQGGGVIDGSGSKWWNSSCKVTKTNPCKEAPTALTLHSSSAVRVKGLTIQNAQQMHFTLANSNSIQVTGIRINSPKDSPNTDGIHISESSDVTIQNVRIAAGDDCISIVNGSMNIKMKNINCGPGHGISIGSLGKDNSYAVVEGIFLDTAKITDTTNGVRIKTWQGGSGHVKAVRFENVMMNNVQNPIIIDQFYCDSPKQCRNQTSAVQISGVLYRNIRGSSKTPRVMNFACSDTVPCSDIVLNNISLQTESGEAETFCNCAMGYDYGLVQPAADCLKNSACGGGGSRSRSRSLNELYEPIHTDL